MFRVVRPRFPQNQHGLRNVSAPRTFYNHDLSRVVDTFEARKRMMPMTNALPTRRRASPMGSTDTDSHGSNRVRTMLPSRHSNVIRAFNVGRGIQMDNRLVLFNVVKEQANSTRHPSRLISRRHVEHIERLYIWTVGGRRTGSDVYLIHLILAPGN